jgi:hypothetical protein
MQLFFPRLFSDSGRTTFTLSECNALIKTIIKLIRWPLFTRAYATTTDTIKEVMGANPVAD